MGNFFVKLQCALTKECEGGGPITGSRSVGEVQAKPPHFGEIRFRELYNGGFKAPVEILSINSLAMIHCNLTKEFEWAPPLLNPPLLARSIRNAKREISNFSEVGLSHLLT